MLQNMLTGNGKKVIQICFHNKDMNSALDIAIEILHETYDLAPITAEDEIGILSQKGLVPNTIEGLDALQDDIITCSALTKGEGKPHLLQNMLFLKSLASRLPKEHTNKFLDNVQADNAEFTFDALLKFVARTVTLLEGVFYDVVVSVRHKVAL